MGKRIGIEQNTEQRVISGARVAFDLRTTAEANDTRSPKNLRAEERSLRKYLWEVRQAAKRTDTRAA